MPNVDLRQLRYLITIAEEGSFTSAAQRLSMTQPALSRTIAALERTVGVALLVRVHRGVELTAAGKVLVARSREITGKLDVALRETRSAAAPVLRVSAKGCDIATLQRLTRGVRAEPVVVERAVDAVRAGDAQVALVRGPFDDAGLDSEVLESQSRVAVLPAFHPLADRLAVFRAELVADPVVQWPDCDPAETEYWMGTDGHGGEAVVGPEVRDMFHMLARVQLGEAIAFLPGRVRDAVAIPSDVRLVEVSDLPPENLSVVWPSEETSTAVAGFVRHAVRSWQAVGEDDRLRGSAEPAGYGG